MIRILAMLLLLLVQTAVGQTLDVTDYRQEDFMGSYTQILRNHRAALSIDQVIEQYQQGAFQATSSATPNFGISLDEAWGLIEISNSGPEKSFILENNFGMIDYFDVYQVIGTEKTLIYQGGDQQAFSSRYLAVRTFNAKIIIPSGKSQIIVRSQGQTVNIMALRLWDEKAYVNHLFWDNSFFGILIGIHLIMILYNLFLVITLKDALYFKYVLFVVFNLIYHVSSFNIGQWIAYSVAGFETYSNHIQLICVDLILLSATAFCWEFLDIKSSKYRKVYPLVILTIGLSLVNLFVFNFVSTWLTTVCTLVGSALAITIFVSLGFLRLWEGYRPALIYLIAWLSYIMGSSNVVMIFLGFGELSTLSYWGHFVGGAAETAIFSIALGVRFSYVKKQNKNQIQLLNEELKFINKNLELKVEMRTKEIHDILRHIPQGIFTFSKNSIIDREYSQYLEILLEEKKLDGRNFLDLLQLHSDLSTDQLNQFDAALKTILHEDSVAFDMNSHLLPNKITFQVPGRPAKQLEIDWNQLAEDNITCKILAAVRDTTEKNYLQQEINQKSKELKLIAQVIEIKAERFSRFQKMSNDMLDEIDHIFKHGINDENLRLILVSYHTLKGVSRSLNFVELSSVIHEAESELVLLRDDNGGREESIITDLHKRVRTTLNEYIDINNHRLGRQADANSVKIARSLVQRFLNYAQQWPSQSPEFKQDIAILKSFYFRTPQDIASDQIAAIKIMSIQLDKPVPQVKYQGPSYGMDPDTAEVFEKVLIHLVRNSLSHGFETGSERLKQGKPESGTITLSQRMAGEFVQILYQDDGRGVSLDEIRTKAEQLGYHDQDLNSLLSLLFRSGFTTRDTVDNISGRGVGLDAVKLLLQRVGGDIGIDAQPSEFYPDRFSLCFRIELPVGSLITMQPLPQAHSEVA